MFLKIYKTIKLKIQGVCGELIEHFKELLEPDLHEVILKRELLEGSDNSTMVRRVKLKGKGKKQKEQRKKSK